MILSFVHLWSPTIVVILYYYYYMYMHVATTVHTCIRIMLLRISVLHRQCVLGILYMNMYKLCWQYNIYF